MTKGLHNPWMFSELSKWINQHPRLQSSDGLCFTDIDFVVHRFRSYVDNLGTREIQYLMFLETKTHGADLSDSQRDSLLMVDQLIRTSLKTQRANGRFETGHPQNTRTVFSWKNQVKVQCVCFGVHTLRMSGTTPDNSQEMLWDRYKKVTADQVAQLLRFELHPDTLKPLCPRRHKRRRLPPALWEWETGLGGDVQGKSALQLADRQGFVR